MCQALAPFEAGEERTADQLQQAEKRLEEFRIRLCTAENGFKLASNMLEFSANHFYLWDGARQALAHRKQLGDNFLDEAREIYDHPERRSEYAERIMHYRQVLMTADQAFNDDDELFMAVITSGTVFRALETNRFYANLLGLTSQPEEYAKPLADYLRASGIATRVNYEERLRQECPDDGVDEVVSWLQRRHTLWGIVGVYLQQIRSDRPTAELIEPLMEELSEESRIFEVATIADALRTCNQGDFAAWLESAAGRAALEQIGRGEEIELPYQFAKLQEGMESVIHIGSRLLYLAVLCTEIGFVMSWYPRRAAAGVGLGIGFGVTADFGFTEQADNFTSESLWTQGLILQSSVILGVYVARIFGPLASLGKGVLLVALIRADLRMD